MIMYRVYFPEIENFADQDFPTLPDAVAYIEALSQTVALACHVLNGTGTVAYFHPDTGLHYAQRIPTVEEAIWIEYDEINAYQLLCEIEDYLGIVCQRDFDHGWDAFKNGVDREDLTNTAQRMGFDKAVACYDAECTEDAAMRLETLERF